MVTFVFLPPSKLDQVVTLLICIWEVPSSNLRQVTEFPKVLPGFIQPFQANAGMVL
jgi:hypothetical protein